MSFTLSAAQVMKADQDTEISRLTADMARLQDTSNIFGLDIGDSIGKNNRVPEDEETRSRESRKRGAGKRRSKTRSRRRPGISDCVPQ